MRRLVVDAAREERLYVRGLSDLTDLPDLGRSLLVLSATILEATHSLALLRSGTLRLRLTAISPRASRATNTP